MTRPLYLTAALPPLELEAATAVPLEQAGTVDTTRRTIVGTIAVWNVPGTPSVGPAVFLDASIALPTELHRVKLLLDHDSSRPVGYLRSVQQLPDRLEGTFYVPEGELGDYALEQARSGLRDALSPGVYVTDYSFDDAGRVVVKASNLNETSLVTIPAFAGAYVSSVTAALGRHDNRNTDTGENMRRRFTTPAQGAPVTDGALVTPGSSPAPAAPAAAPAATPPGAAAGVTLEAAQQPAQQPQQRAADALELEASHVRQVVEAVREAAQGRVAAEQQPGLNLEAMLDLTMRHLRNGGQAAQLPMILEAALADVTPANLTPSGATGEYGPRRPQYVDDLWQLADVERPTVDAFGPPRPLTSLEVRGWVWETRPEVARYSGNKTDVPSNQPKRKRLTQAAQRFAGGWDIDRVFVDLPGGTDEVRDVLVEATRSYAEQSEAYVAETITAAATPLYGAALTVPAALATLGTYFAKITGARVGYIRMGVDAWDDFANMTEADAPWWLRKMGAIELGEGTGAAGNLRFSIDPTLTGTQLVAADRRAARVWEVDPPVRVQALDVARGGIDVGVFGYIAAMTTEPRLIVNIDTAGRAEG